jgi:acetyl esterase/lipase
LVSNLAKSLKCPCLAVDYRLAPEHPYPAAVDDALAAWKVIAATHPSANILLSGDSAGGGLSVVLMQKLRDEGLRMPDAAILFSPWTDLTCESATYESHAKRDPFLFPRVVRDYARYYLGEDGDRRDPFASPIFGDLGGLPRTLVMVGDREILLDDSRILGEKAKAAGSPVEVEVWPEMVHVWPAFIPYIPEGKQALRRIADWLA